MGRLRILALGSDESPERTRCAVQMRRFAPLR